jgi:ribosomal protein S18 acetylase RimI-like enzyme
LTAGGSFQGNSLMLTYRRLLPEDGVAAADIHRIAGALIPDYDTSLHTQEEYYQFYAETVLPSGPVWGAFEDGVLRGHIALREGWIDHLYVDPAAHGSGIGSALLKIAQAEMDELRLYTFQSNVRARRFYEWHGFEIEELTDGARNEEKMPDITYHWRRSTAA